MAVYEKGFETKRNLILTTYQLLQERDASTITVRELAKLNQCSPAALYRHFDTLEYLITMASLKFFEPYMLEYSKLMETEEDLLKQYLEGWFLFNHYAFQRPDLYYRLLWGQYNKEFSDAFMEYMELFPLEASSVEDAGYFYTMIFNSDITERDFLMLRRLENHGLINDSQASYFSRSNPLLVKGMLEESMRQDADERKKTEHTCNMLLLKNMRDVENVKA